MKPSEHDVCVEWVATYLTPYQRINHMYGEAYLRNAIKQDTGVKLTRGDFCELMIESGFDPVDFTAPRWKFRIDPSPLKARDKDRRLRQYAMEDGTRSDAPITRAWTENEERILLTYADRYDLNWPGWPEVLPGRSLNSIKRKLRMLRFGTHEGKCKSKANTKEMIVKLSHMGLSPSQIDVKLDLIDGTARKVLVSNWAIENRG